MASMIAGIPMATKLRLNARSFRRMLDPKGKKNLKGITLIELIAVAVGLGVLALIVAPNVENALGLTKNATYRISGHC